MSNMIDIVLWHYCLQIANKYPNSKVEMRMSSSQTPVVQMRPDSLGASFTGNIDFYAHTPSGQGASLFTLNVVSKRFIHHK